MQLSIQQALSYARGAGFSGEGLNRIIAIAMCESGLDTHPRDNTAGNTPPSRDRGLYQINSFWHPEVTDAEAYDPAAASKAVYRISRSGSVFTEWSTYTNGCSDTKIAAVRAANNGAPVAQIVNNADVRTLVPWVTYARIDNLGGVEPFGGFPKPDSNIQIPANFPVQALLPGTVTAIDGGQVAWGAVVTIKLDKPINSLATHTAYLHLARTVVSVGQHVDTGTLIAYNGYSAAAGAQKVPLGFALYPGDHYGFGSEWASMTKANLQGLLSPVSLLDSAKGGSLQVNSGSGFNGTSGGGSEIYSATAITNRIVSSSEAAYNIINNVPGFTGICEALDRVEQFVPFQLTTKAAADASTATQNNDFQVWGWDTGITNPVGVAKSASAAVQLPADTMQSILIFTVTNFGAFASRALFVTIGFIMFWALMINFGGELFADSPLPKIAGDVIKG